MNERKTILRVKDLQTTFFTDSGEVPAVDHVDFHLNEGEILGIVGESGCGKSVTSLSIMGLVPNPPGKIVGGEILFDDKDLIKLTERQMRRVRGNDIAMIFQEPMTSLNPLFTIGNQMIEAVLIHEKDWSKKKAEERAIEMLKLVGLPRASDMMRDYPHQLSGGMRQRVMIAMALACDPKVLIADEPTTALDVTIQAQILKLMKDLNTRLNTAVLLITHDLGVVAETCERVIVMYAGQIIEEAPVKMIFQDPQHPYTKGLIQSVPDMRYKKERLFSIKGNVPRPGTIQQGCRFAARCEFAFDRCHQENPDLYRRLIPMKHAAFYMILKEWSQMTKPLLKVDGLKKYFPVKKGLLGKTVGQVKAVDDVSFYVNEGETLGIVGESGCGKSTTGRMLMRLLEPTEGKVEFNGKNLTSLSAEEMRKMRRDIQMVFQDPYASLNPRHTVEKILEEPLIVHGMKNSKERKKKIHEFLEIVGLSSYHAKRYPHQFSGGQRQRIGIARALMTNPKLIIADEPVSALDVSIQAQVLNLMKDLQKDFNLTYIFIAHDLGVVRHISDRVGVMYLGKIVEIADSELLYEHPLHPYTKALLSAVPIPDPNFEKEEILLEGDIPNPANPPTGCTFHTRCPFKMDVCTRVVPKLVEMEKGHSVACHLYDADAAMI